MAAKKTAQASSTEESSPMLKMIRAMAVYDPEYMVEAIQKAVPFANVPGIDLARLTEIQQKNQAALEGVARMEKEVLSRTAKREFTMLEEQMGEILGAVQALSTTDSANPLDASVKQTELAVRAMDKLTQETADLIKDVGSQHMEIIKSMAKRYVDAIEEIKSMAKNEAAKD